jgi:sialidase-1
MKKTFPLWLLLLLFLISGCKIRSEKDKNTTATIQNEYYEYFVAPVGPQNTRNSEAAIVSIKDGSLLLAWTEFYDDDGADHGPARISGKVSTDNGRTWGEKYILVKNDGGCNVMEVNFIRLNTGDLALFYLQKNTESTDCRIMMRTSSDEGKSWINPRQLSPSGKYTGLTNGRSIRLRSGRILLEAWEGGYCYCVISDDDGESWHDSQHIKPDGGDCYENACVELKDGNVLMLMRTGLGGQYRSISSDGGESWSDPLITQLTGTAAPASISRVPETGDLLVIWTHNPDTKSLPGNRNRNPLTSAISYDEGETWEHFRNLEDAPDDAWAYPAVTWINNRALITYFNYKGGISLKLKSLPKEWFYQ